MGELAHENALPYPPVSDDSINLAPLIAGSEGTLAIIRKAEIRLVPLPAHTVLAVLTYPSIADACDAVPALLELGPSAVELIPQNLIKMARSVPSFASQLSLLDPIFAGGKEPPALLVVEFSGRELDGLLQPGETIAARAPGTGRRYARQAAPGLGNPQSRPGIIPFSRR